MVQQKSFLTFLLLSIITCGIYSLYYLYRMTKDINQMAGDDGYYTRTCRCRIAVDRNLRVLQLVLAVSAGQPDETAG